MPLYALIGHDVPNSQAKRQAIRSAHLERLQILHAQQRLILAGPTPAKHDEPTMTGSIIIAEFANDADVQMWVSEEPYLQTGVYSHVDIKPFIQALP